MKWSERIAAAIKAHPKGKPLNKDGSEIPDPVPMDPPIGYKPQPSMFEVIRKMIHDERVRQALEEEGLETPDEADDFDVEDDYEPASPYEHGFDQPSSLGELERMRNSLDERIRNFRATEGSSPGSPLGTGSPASAGQGPAGPPPEVKSGSST